jgi:hypothetical protein
MRDARFRLMIIMALGAVVALIWLFPSWYPILNPNTVSISYPGLELEVQVDYALLPQDAQQAYEALRDGDEDTEQAPRPDTALALIRARLLGVDFVVPDELQLTEIPSDATIIRRGTFITPSPISGASGDLIIYQTPSLQRFIRLENGFSVTRAPEIHLVFTRNPDPYDPNGVGVDYIDVGALVYNVGTQTYPVPDSVDFAQYPIVALYAPSINFVLSSATLR